MPKKAHPDWTPRDFLEYLQGRQPPFPHRTAGPRQHRNGPAGAGRPAEPRRARLRHGHLLLGLPDSGADFRRRDHGPLRGPGGRKRLSAGDHRRGGIRHGPRPHPVAGGPGPQPMRRRHGHDPFHDESARRGRRRGNAPPDARPDRLHPAGGGTGHGAVSGHGRRVHHSRRHRGAVPAEPAGPGDRCLGTGRLRGSRLRRDRRRRDLAAAGKGLPHPGAGAPGGGPRPSAHPSSRFFRSSFSSFTRASSRAFSMAKRMLFLRKGLVMKLAAPRRAASSAEASEA